MTQKNQLVTDQYANYETMYICSAVDKCTNANCSHRIPHTLASVSWENMFPNVFPCHTKGCECDDRPSGDEIIVCIPVSNKENDPNGIDQHAPGAKLDAGKVLAAILGDFGLALMEVAKVGTFGANKYTRRGWEELPEGELRYTDAMWRHLLKEHWEEFDPDSNLLHEAHLAWNVLARLELKLRRLSE